MRDIELRVFRGVITVMAAVGAFSFISASAAAQPKGLEQRVSDLETQVATLWQRMMALTRPTTLDVDCGAGQRLNVALFIVQGHPAPATLNVSGVCRERIVITRSDLTIRAAAPGAGITSPSLGPAVTVGTGSSTPRAVVLEGLTITGGNSSVMVEQASQVRLTDCVVGGGGNGFVVQASHRSSVRLDNTIVADGTNSGVFAQTGAHIVVSGGAIRNNGGNGINLDSRSTAVIDGGTQVVANSGDGVFVDNGSSLRLGAASVSNNAFAGVFVSGGSSVYLTPGATIDGNVRNGITLMDTSLAQKFRAVSDIHITNNGGYGIVCSVPPAVAQIVGFTFETGNISGNVRGNIECPISPGPRAP